MTLRKGIIQIQTKKPQKISLEESRNLYSTRVYEILKSTFNYDNFRHDQLEIILSVLAGHDTLVLMPTGSGKSLAFQIPALVLGGVAVVVSPLIALMQNQVDSLQRKGVEARMISSSLKVSEKNRVVDDLKSKNPRVKILYVTPETLSLNHFSRILRNLKNRKKLSLFAIDEAHCLSKWGNSFRPKYRELGNLKNIYDGIPIVALTATATDKIQEDIIETLQFEDFKVFKTSFNRSNIKYIVKNADKMKNGVLDDISVYLTDNPNDSGIIYCHKRNQCETLAASLQDLGFSAAPYHSGIKSDQKEKYLTDWIENKIRIIVATIAFGMGIDKPDVRFVMHHSLSKNIEDYYQESGRAGRDGLQSVSIVYYSSSNESYMNYIISLNKKPDTQKRLNDFQGVIDFCLVKGCRRRKVSFYFNDQLLEYFLEEGVECNNCDWCLGFHKKKIRRTTSSPSLRNQKSTQSETFTNLTLFSSASSLLKKSSSSTAISSYSSNRRKVSPSKFKLPRKIQVVKQKSPKKPVLSQLTPAPNKHALSQLTQAPNKLTSSQSTTREKTTTIDLTSPEKPRKREQRSILSYFTSSGIKRPAPHPLSGKVLKKSKN